MHIGVVRPSTVILKGVVGLFIVLRACVARLSIGILTGFVGRSTVAIVGFACKVLC